MRLRSLRPYVRLTPRLLLGLASLLGVCAVALAGDAARTAALPVAAYTFGAENSWIRVQNIGSGDANVDVSYFDEAGRLAGKDSCPSASCPAMFPGSGWTFFQRDNPTLPSGYQGSAVVSTDQPIVALLAKDVTRPGSFAIAGDTLVTGAGSHRIYLPVNTKRDGAAGDWSTRFVIQNLSDTVTACVTITYLANAVDDEVAWEPFKLPSSGSPSKPVSGCPNGGMALAPRGSIFRFADNMPIPDRVTGSVRIDLSKNAGGQGPEKQFISATADSWNANIASFGSYHGFDESELGTEIILPLMDRQVGPQNSYSTRFSIVNKTPSKPAQVTIRFDGYDLSSGSPAFVTKSNTLTVRGARQCFQDRDDFANCLAAGDRLPFNFVGTARISSSEPVAVVVDRGTWLNQTFANYRGVRPQDASQKVLLPVLNKNYGYVAGVGNGWNSWFRVMVADGGFANVTVRYYGLDLPGGSVAYTQRVDREFTAVQGLEPMLPDGFAGTAIIESDRPIVALAGLTTDVFSGDTDYAYNGVSLR